jgi:hypothetical protein
MAKNRKKTMTKKTSKKSKPLKKQMTFSSNQILLFVLAFAAVGAVAVWQSLAATHSSNNGTGPLTLATISKGSGTGTSGTNDIEQQPGVTYSGSCLWSLDSNEKWSGYGYLAAGTSASSGDCLIADIGQHLTGVNFTSTSANLKVTISYQPQGRSYSIKPVKTSTGYQYKGCVAGPFYSTLPLLPQVPDSTGGNGVLTQINITITNPTNQTIKKIAPFAVFGPNSPDLQGICTGTITDVFMDAGALWQTGI